MQDGYADAGQHAADDVGFSESASSAVDKREEKAFEEGGGLVQGFLQCFVEVYIELLGIVDVFSDSREEYVVQESLGKSWS